MKYIFGIAFFIVINFPHCKAQTNDLIVADYIEMNKSDGMIKLNHGPFETDFDSLQSPILFFIVSWNVEAESYNNYGVLYDTSSELYSEFGYNNIDPSFGRVVISVFFENVDDDTDKEMIVIYEIGYRSHYSPNGGYAGIKAIYQTRVFKHVSVKGNHKITEYEIIGVLLTVNLPIETGTYEEEIIIGREDNKLRDILGVTYNAIQVKKRIKLLKENGLLGG